MTNSPNNHLTVRRWVSPAVGFVVGALSLFLASLIDAITFGLPFSRLTLYIPEYLLAGFAFALCSLEPFRALLTQQSDAAGATERSLFAATAALVLFLAPAVLFAPNIPLSWLLYFYAFLVLIDWLARRFLIQDARASTSRVAAYLDSMPHAPFVVAGLVCLALTPFYLSANQQTPAERLANWAYGFLVLGVGTALLDLLAPMRAKEWSRRFPQAAVAVLLLSFVGIGYVSQDRLTQAEDSYLKYVQPDYLAKQMGNKDVVISASPNLRLGKIAGTAVHLDLLPDQQGLALWNDLATVLQNKRNAFWVQVPDDSNDKQGILASFLKSNGCLDDIPNTALPLQAYELRMPLATPKVLPPTIANRVPDAFRAAQVDFGSIQLTGFNFEPKVCSHDAVAVALQWRLVKQTDVPLQVTLSLLDAKGRRIQSKDFDITDTQNKTTDLLADGTQMSGYYLVVVPFGTPPGQYTLAAVVHPAPSSQRFQVNSAGGVVAASVDSVTLGQIQIYRAREYQADPYQTLKDSNLLPAKVQMSDGLTLEAYGVGNQTVKPGNDVGLTLRWRARLDSLPSYTVRLRLREGDKIITEMSGIPVDGTYPTTRWRVDEAVVDRWDVRVPADAPGGKAQIRLGLEASEMYYIADVTVATVTHTYQIPPFSFPVTATLTGVGDLIGYDLDRTQVSSNGTVVLTLYWRATSSAVDKNYTVFVQLLTPDGRLIAQRDSAPADGQRPTRGWVNGEIIADRHVLNFSDKTYQGDATLIIGMYDPATLVRVPIKDSSTNFVQLPTKIRVTTP